MQPHNNGQNPQNGGDITRRRTSFFTPTQTGQGNSAPLGSADDLEGEEENVIFTPTDQRRTTTAKKVPKPPTTRRPVRHTGPTTVQQQFTPPSSMAPMPNSTVVPVETRSLPSTQHLQQGPGGTTEIHVFANGSTLPSTVEARVPAPTMWHPFIILLFSLVIIGLGVCTNFFEIYTTYATIAASYVIQGTAPTPLTISYWLSASFWQSPDTWLAGLPGLIVQCLEALASIVTSDTYVEIFKHWTGENGEEEEEFNPWSDPLFLLLTVVELAGIVINIWGNSSYVMKRTGGNRVTSSITTFLLVIGALVLLPASIRVFVWSAKRCWADFCDWLFPANPRGPRRLTKNIR